MWQSIMGMLGSMGGAGGAGGMLGGAAGGAAGGASAAGGSTGASLMKGLGAAADYYNNAGKPQGMQQQPQGMSLMDALAKQKQFREHAVMKKMADYEPTNIPAQATNGIQSMIA